MKKVLLILLLLGLVPIAGQPPGLQSDWTRGALENLAAAQEPDNKDVTVFVTPSGTKYHRAGCRYLSGGGVPLSLAEATKHYTPCSICNPPLLGQATSNDPPAGPTISAPPSTGRTVATAPPDNPAAETPQEKGIAVYFSPNGGCTEAIVRELNQANKTVLVQAYSFTSTAIAKALVEAHKRGVKITVILDKSQRTKNYSAADFVAHAEIPCYIDAKHTIAHNKIILIDGRTIITGSFNFTKAAETSNAENLLVIHDHPNLYAAYEANFNLHLGHSEAYAGR